MFVDVIYEPEFIRIGRSFRLRSGLYWFGRSENSEYPNNEYFRLLNIFDAVRLLYSRNVQLLLHNCQAGPGMNTLLLPSFKINTTQLISA